MTDDYVYDYYNSGAYGLTQGQTAAITGIVIGVYVVTILLTVAMLAGMWKIFVKAGKPGWAAIIPIYNMVVLLEIVNKPTWWVVLLLIPFVNIVVSILLSVEVAKAFGKSSGYAVGMVLLPYVFYPILGFGKAQYVGNSEVPENDAVQVEQ